jgi:hypothetical protein
LSPTTAPRDALGFMGFMNAGFGARFAFFFGAAFFAAFFGAFFAPFFAAFFFAAMSFLLGENDVMLERTSRIRRATN